MTPLQKHIAITVRTLCVVYSPDTMQTQHVAGGVLLKHSLLSTVESERKIPLFIQRPAMHLFEV